jgi:predicted aldo/keto reductase-like oxidoreductase
MLTQQRWHPTIGGQAMNCVDCGKNQCSACPKELEKLRQTIERVRNIVNNYDLNNTECVTEIMRIVNDKEDKQ